MNRIQSLISILKTVVLIPIKLLSMIFGKISWAAPAWLAFIKSSINGARQRRPKVFWGMVAGLILAFVGYQYYQSLPKPITVTASVISPEITPNYENSKPDKLLLEFMYDFSALNRDQTRPTGTPSAARVDLVNEEIIEGIEISPAKKGIWKWSNDHQIQFVPETDWPADTKFEVKLDKKIFSPITRLSDHTYKFRTKKFNLEFASIEFYQDPQDISVRRVISTIRFTHPVDKESFEKNITMAMRPSDSAITISQERYKFDISYDKNFREAYLQSEPVKLPAEPNYMTVAVNKGVNTLLGGESSDTKIDNKILIPAIYSFLKVSSASTEIIRNQKNEPEQVLMLEFTDDLDEKEVLKKLSAYILPDRNQDQGKSHWNSPREVTDNVLQRSEKISLKLIPNERTASKFYSFVFEATENRYIYIKLDAGFTSVNKFIHAGFFDTIARAPTYPKEVNIAGEGSVLTYSGEQKLSVLTRGIPAVKYTVGKLLKGQLYHLVSQTEGDIKNPHFKNWNLDKENISEFVSEIVNVNADHPRIANYSSLDLSKHMPNESNRFGLFFVEAKAWDINKNREIYGASDTRLILVSDLGLIVKNNADQTHQVFVQSINTGRPVAGATVELLGKNGIPIYTRVTSEEGHALIPSTKDFSNEKQPTVYIVKSNTDLSFIPFNRSSRQINLSKFDIGGVDAGNAKSNALNAFLFSDRGIYRPGEKVKIGMIVKYANLNNIEGIPLEIVVNGPRINEVKVTRVSLPEKGFF